MAWTRISLVGDRIPTSRHNLAGYVSSHSGGAGARRRPEGFRAARRLAQRLARSQSRHRLHACCSIGGSPSGQVQSKAGKKTSKGDRIIASLLSLSTLPLTTYVPLPKTVLHIIHPSVKLAYTLVFLVSIAKTPSISAKLCIASMFILVQMVTFPPRLWKPQVLRTLTVSGLVLLFTACGSDGVSPVLSGGRAVEQSIDAHQLILANRPHYSYTLLNLGILSVTKRSWALAVTLFSLTTMTLTTASIVLLTTPPEKIAMSLKSVFLPLRLIGVETNKLFMMTVMSLRFMSVVFEEMRHILLGLASRGINFGSLGVLGALNIVLKAGSELFRRLFARSDRVSTAMVARGVVDMGAHKVIVDEGLGGVYDVDARGRGERMIEAGRAIAINIGAVVLLIAGGGIACNVLVYT
jgi:energy-coupling factor transporter transmembrane protein EcfT